MKSAIFWDRDGVINYAVQRETEITSPWTMDEFYFVPQIKEAMMITKELGYANFVVTNQPDVYRGRMTPNDLDDFHNLIYNYLPIFGIEYAEIKGDHNYKPNSGMITDSIKSFNIDPSKSFMIGDRWKDIVAGHNAGVKTIYIRNEYCIKNKHTACTSLKYHCPDSRYIDIKPDFKAYTPMEASFIIKQEKK